MKGYVARPSNCARPVLVLPLGTETHQQYFVLCKRVVSQSWSIVDSSPFPAECPLTYSTNTDTCPLHRIFSYHPLKLSDHVFVGASSIIEAALIGNRVYIGANCHIGKFVMIRDCVRILEGSVVPAGMVIPSFSVVAGRPARVVGELAEGEEEGLEGREIYRTVGN